MNFIRRMMAGRQGADRLGFALLCASLVSMGLRRLVGWKVFYPIALLFLTVFFLRAFSRDIGKRMQEEQWFLGICEKVRIWFHSLGDRTQDCKTHRYFKCPSCGKKLRVPRGRGKIAITCPTCRTEFTRKS